MNANSRARPAVNGDDSLDVPPGAARPSDERMAQNTAIDGSPTQSSPRVSSDATSSSGHERPDLTGPGNESAITGDAVAAAGGDRAEETRGQGLGAPAGTGDGDAGNGAGRGSGGSGGSSSSRDGRSGGSGGRGGGPRGYGTSGVAPQRAESPNALPDAPENPGKAIEVVLPAFAPARGDSAGDDSMGTKRKATATDQALAYQARHKSGTGPNEPATREPVQRWPNWVFQVLHK
jgi:hypothetical protein